MKKLILVIFLMVPISISFAQGREGSEIYLTTITWKKGFPKIGNIENITKKPGYDNQPCFTADSKDILYVSTQGLSTELFKYNLEQESYSPVFQPTKGEDEFSPVETPDGMISFVRVEKDSAQRIWKFNPSTRKSSMVSPRLDSVGYYHWIDAENIMAYRITTPHSLAIFNIKNEAWTDLKKKPARCFQKIGGQLYVSFFENEKDEKPSIFKLKPDLSFEKVAKGYNKTGDFAVTPDGKLFQSEGLLILLFNPVKNIWEDIGTTLVASIKEISRINVSPDGTRFVLTTKE